MNKPGRPRSVNKARKNLTVYAEDAEMLQRLSEDMGYPMVQLIGMGIRMINSAMRRLANQQAGK